MSTREEVMAELEALSSADRLAFLRYAEDELEAFQTELEANFDNVDLMFKGEHDKRQQERSSLIATFRVLVALLYTVKTP